MKNNFSELSKIECYNESFRIRENAERKYSSALLLADNGDLGSGISLFYISMEEYIKAHILLLDGYGFRFRSIKGMKKALVNHELKHLIAFIIDIITSSKEEINTFLEFTKIIEPIIKVEIKPGHKKLLSIIAISFIGSKYLEDKKLRIKKELPLFFKGEFNRRKGLYQDAKFNENLSNQRFSDYEFKALKNKIERLQKSFNEIVEELPYTESGTHPKVEELQKSLLSSNIYARIGSGIKKFSTDKEKSYAAIIDYIENLKELLILNIEILDKIFPNLRIEEKLKLIEEGD